MSAKKQSVDMKVLTRIVNRVAFLKNKLAPMELEYVKKTRKIIEEIKEKEGLLVEMFKHSDLENFSTTKGRVLSKESSVPQIEDYDTYLDYIFKNKRKVMDLLMRAVNTAGARARWEHGESIPGVKPFDKRTASVKPLAQGAKK